MSKKIKKMDNETLRKLAGLLPCNNDFTVSFIPEMYKDIEDDFKPTFTIKPFTSKEVREIAVKMQEKVDQSIIIESVKSRVVSWSNLISLSTNEEIAFDITIFETFPQKLINEITSEVLKISGLG